MDHKLANLEKKFGEWSPQVESSITTMAGNTFTILQWARDTVPKLDRFYREDQKIYWEVAGILLNLRELGESSRAAITAVRKQTDTGASIDGSPRKLMEKWTVVSCAE